MFNRKDYVDYLMLELENFKRWYTQDGGGFSGNRDMLQVFDGALTALTMINFNDLDKELYVSIIKVKEITMNLRKQANNLNTSYTSQAVAMCYKALSILVNKLK